MVFDRDSVSPEQFVVEVFSELPQPTVEGRWRELNVLLRLSMLTGLQMQLEATLDILCDFAGEIAAFDRALVYFWEEEDQKGEPRATRGMDAAPSEVYARGNILNLWAAKYGRPLLIAAGKNLQADAFLEAVGSEMALVVPLFAANQVMGSIQLFAARRSAFTRPAFTKPAFTKEDAQLLWVLALVAENQLTREYANEGLLRFAFTDYLTGLKTRGYFEQQLDLEIKRAERKQAGLALLMVDIDHFKQLNDHYGHHVGDQVLRDVTAILMKDMREVDTVARYGGEEFVIILPETAAGGALFVAERLRNAVAQSKFFAGSVDAVEHLTISIGIAVFDTDAQFKRDLIEYADAALYAAKAGGRNQVVLYSDLMLKQRKEA
ncbi:MAG: sensor domain-containing diguanylate cyclase [Acidobacteriota bacterium]|nr:sensor domain-containing diguanylate cyclase [Acidobacteriota bacterium]